MVLRSRHVSKHVRIWAARFAALLLPLVVVSVLQTGARAKPTTRPQETDLSQSQRSTLKEIIGAARQKGASKTAKGIGVLFVGAQDKQQTAAAQMLAKELGRDLYRVDLSKIVSKYIGETEKNLRQVFAAVRASDSILFFDEADALFGKRSEVKDGHDRYANIEINYLLQQIEKYDGITIITAKRKESIDQAFMRRLRFIVEFPPPRRT
jgi:SpoVK/Ycf46/Vps4 family AAA+-type ATPase